MISALDAGAVSAGPLGLLVVVLMSVATVLLIRNMNARLRRLPREFPEPPFPQTPPFPQSPPSSQPPLDGPTGRHGG